MDKENGKFGMEGQPRIGFELLVHMYLNNNDDLERYKSIFIVSVILHT